MLLGGSAVVLFASLLWFLGGFGRVVGLVLFVVC